MDDIKNFKEAKIYPLNLKKYYAIEFPGYIKNIERVNNMLGGSESISKAFSKSNLIELRYRPSNSFCHPLNGDIINTANPLLKITRRRKKAKEGEPPGKWEIKYEIVGIVSKTSRFRGMSDYQFIPNSSYQIPRLVNAVKTLNIEEIDKYQYATDKTDIRNLCNLPPPVFTSIECPQNYGYNQNTAVVKVLVKKKDQEPEMKLINRTKKMKIIAKTANLSDSNSEVPSEPPAVVIMHASYIPKEYTDEIKKLFNERPIWNRIGIINNLSSECRKRIKQLLPLVAYVVPHGAFRDCWIRYGYDPRKNIESRFYQVMDIRNIKGRPRPLNRAKRFQITENTQNSKLTQNSQEEKDNNHEEKKEASNIFDGKTFSGIVLYQLCDIYDVKLKKMINTKKSISNEFNERDGWFTRQHIEKIREELRKKIQKILDTNGNKNNVDEMETDDDDYVESEVESDNDQNNDEKSSNTEAINNSIKELMKNLSKASNSNNEIKENDLMAIENDDDYYDDIFGNNESDSDD